MTTTTTTTTTTMMIWVSKPDMFMRNCRDYCFPVWWHLVMYLVMNENPDEHTSQDRTLPRGIVWFVIVCFVELIVLVTISVKIKHINSYYSFDVVGLTDTWLSLTSPWYSWLCGTVVERWSLTGELSLSCAQPAADGWPLMWVNRSL